MVGDAQIQHFLSWWVLATIMPLTHWIYVFLTMTHRCVNNSLRGCGAPAGALPECQKCRKIYKDIKVYIFSHHFAEDILYFIFLYKDSCALMLVANGLFNNKSALVPITCFVINDYLNQWWSNFITVTSYWAWWRLKLPASRGVTIIYSTFCSGADHTKDQSSRARFLSLSQNCLRSVLDNNNLLSFLAETIWFSVAVLATRS